MDVRASADRLQSERLVVSIETLREEIKKVVNRKSLFFSW